MTLYLKYRPQKLEELDSESVRESLKKIVASGKIPHAFLFAGPKGTGKTSAARIVAKILNCESIVKLTEPCGKCEQCISISSDSNLDVIEMDAASHRGIDDVRTLRDAVKLATAKAKNKVYIIDEVHMLTTEAGNALLKTLEEPPQHVYFILATTNPEKLLETIRSRVTQIPFKKANNYEVVRSLQRVVKGEKVKVDTKILELIAKAAYGSFRDAVKILEQLMTEQRKLSYDSVAEFLFHKKAFDVESFLEILAKRDTKAALKEINTAVTSGVTVDSILGGVLERLREGLLAKVGMADAPIAGFEKDELLSLIKLLTYAAKGVEDTPIEELPLEVAIVEWCERVIDRRSSVGETDPPSESPRDPQLPSQSIKEVSEEVWRQILATIKPLNTSIEALLRAAKPISYDGSSLTLGVFYKFHKERLEEFNYRRVLEGVVSDIMGRTTRVICVLTQPPVKKVISEQTVGKEDVVLTEGDDKDIIKVAEEIFGN